MLAVVAPRPSTPVAALGAPLLTSFLALSALHSDGWGHASAAGHAPIVRTGLTPARDAALDIAGTISLLYLRFASADSSVTPANLQPFVADGVAFAHNGALHPRSRALETLTDRERADLGGTTDSEVYFAIVRRALRAHPDAASGAAAAAARVRELYPTACMNAMLIVDGSLVVVHARGTVEPPIAAFARRGVAAGDLPPGHDDTYNVLATAVLPTGARVVATSGLDTTRIDTAPWTPLADDTVHVFTPDGATRSTRI